jgi:hypothetical protein
MGESSVDRLTAISFDDLETSLGWIGQAARPLLPWLGRGPARRFAIEVDTFDRDIAGFGIVEAARNVLARHVGRLLVKGALRCEGPTLVLSNHPGVTDALALMLALGDRNARFVAAERPFFRAMPNLLPQLILAPEDAMGRLRAFRAIGRELAEGRTVVTFPAGAIEPDPLLHVNTKTTAIDERALEGLVRRTPGLRVVRTAIGGVLSPKAVGRALARLQRTPRDRERAAAMLQVLTPSLRSDAVRVVISEPVAPADASRLDPTPELFEPAGWREIVLASDHSRSERTRQIASNTSTTLSI